MVAIVTGLDIGVFNVIKFFVLSIVTLPTLEVLYAKVSLLASQPTRGCSFEPLRWRESSMSFFCLHGKWRDRNTRIMLYVCGTLMVAVSVALEYGTDSTTIDLLTQTDVMRLVNTSQVSTGIERCTVVGNGTYTVSCDGFFKQNEVCLAQKGVKEGKCPPYERDTAIDWVSSARLISLNNPDMVEEGLEGLPINPKCDNVGGLEMEDLNITRNWTAEYTFSDKLWVMSKDGVAVQIHKQAEKVKIFLVVKLRCSEEGETIWSTTHPAPHIDWREQQVRISRTNSYYYDKIYGLCITEGFFGMCFKQRCGHSGCYLTGTRIYLSAAHSKKDFSPRSNTTSLVVGIGEAILEIGYANALDEEGLAQYFDLSGAYLYGKRGAGAEGIDRELAYLYRRLASAIRVNGFVSREFHTAEVISGSRPVGVITNTGIIAYGIQLLMVILLIVLYLRQYVKHVSRQKLEQQNEATEIWIGDSMEYVLDLWEAEKNGTCKCGKPPKSQSGVGIVDVIPGLQHVTVTHKTVDEVGYNVHGHFVAPESKKRD